MTDSFNKGAMGIHVRVELVKPSQPNRSSVSNEELQAAVNRLAQDGVEIFQIVPYATFKNKSGDFQERMDAFLIYGRQKK